MKTGTMTTLDAAALDNVLGRLAGVVETPNGFKATCPSHNDNNPSLSIKCGYRGVLIKCWAGCSLPEILRAIGLTESDLFYDAPAARSYKVKGTTFEKANLHWRWPWRRQVNELLAITETRAALSEDFLEHIKTIDPETITDSQRDVLMEQIAVAYAWGGLAEEVGELAFAITQKMRQEEGNHYV